MTHRNDLGDATRPHVFIPGIDGRCTVNGCDFTEKWQYHVEPDNSDLPQESVDLAITIVGEWLHGASTAHLINRIAMAITSKTKVSAICAHCKTPLYHTSNGDLTHLSNLRTCRNSNGVFGAERVETAAACLLYAEECRAVTLTGEDYWTIPRDIYDQLRDVLALRLEEDHHV